MTSDKNYSFFWRGFIVWPVIIGAEFLHGALRVLLLEPFIGDFRARQTAVFSGILIILTISYFFAGRMRARNNYQLLAVGSMWVVLTFTFEITFGILLNLSWERIFSDYDLTRGGLMPLGLLFLFFAPLIGAKLRKRV